MATTGKIAVSWIELALIILLIFGGMGIWIFVGQRVNLYLKPSEPEESDFQQQFKIPVLESEFSDAKAHLDAIQTKLNEQKIQLYVLEASITALDKIHPELAEAEHKAPVSESVKNYKDKTIELETTKTLVKTLQEDLTRTIEDNAGKYSALIKAQKSSAKELAEAQRNFSTQKLYTMSLWGLPLIFVFFLLALLAAFFTNYRKCFNANLGIIFGGGALILSVLLAYQIFEVMGAALVGTLILIIALSFLPRQT